MSSYLLISDAAKEVNVESHVLRYWEEELHLSIKRNELGHRYYTAEDVERFKQIKSMKERGLQLKAIRMILKDGKLDVLPQEDIAEEAEERANGASAEPAGGGIVAGDGIEPVQESREEKAKRLQWILQQMIRQAVQENNQELICEMKEGILKELDYQFRMQEEREEERARAAAERTDAYYQKLDELLRKKSRGRRVTKGDLKVLEQKERELTGMGEVVALTGAGGTNAGRADSDRKKRNREKGGRSKPAKQKPPRQKKENAGDPQGKKKGHFIF